MRNRYIGVTVFLIVIAVLAWQFPDRSDAAVRSCKSVTVDNDGDAPSFAVKDRVRAAS